MINRLRLFLAATATLGYAVVNLADRGLAFSREVMVRRDIEAQTVENRYHTYDVGEGSSGSGGGGEFGGAVGTVYPKQGYAVLRPNHQRKDQSEGENMRRNGAACRDPGGTPAPKFHRGPPASGTRTSPRWGRSFDRYRSFRYLLRRRPRRWRRRSEE